MGRVFIDIDIAPTRSENRIKNMYGQIQTIVDKYVDSIINEPLFFELCRKLEKKQQYFDHIELPPSCIFIRLYGDGLSKENGQFEEELRCKLIKSPKYEEYADKDGLEWYNNNIKMMIKNMEAKNGITNDK